MIHEVNGDLPRGKAKPEWADVSLSGAICLKWLVSFQERDGTTPGVTCR